MPTKQQRASAKSSDPNRANLVLTLYDGSRKQLPDDLQVLIRINDGFQKQLFSKFKKGSSFTFDLPFSDNLADNLTVLVTADDHVDAGFFPVALSKRADAIVDLMLLPDDANFHFSSWDDIKQGFPALFKFLCCGRDEQQARAKFEDLKDTRPAAVASLLNLATAMAAIQLPAGTPLDYFKEILWDESMAQDRFFGYADSAIIQQVKNAVLQNEFAPEPHPGLFHPDATSSFKQIQLGEANVQLTFHENDTKTIGGVTCVKIEPDIDYFNDLGAHAIMEVIPNSITHGLTDPKKVYVLRWIAGRHAGIASFDPPYTLEA